MFLIKFYQSSTSSTVLFENISFERHRFRPFQTWYSVDVSAVTIHKPSGAVAPAKIMAFHADYQGLTYDCQLGGQLSENIKKLLSLAMIS